MEIKKQSINDRVKKLREEARMTQNQFGDIIGTSQNYLSSIEKGSRPVTEKIKKIICLTSWNGKLVNKAWLEKGEGEMFVQLEETDELANMVSDLLEEPDNELFIIIQEVMHTYRELRPESKELFKDICKSLINNIKKREG